MYKLGRGGETWKRRIFRDKVGYPDPRFYQGFTTFPLLAGRLAEERQVGKGGDGD